jgi:hypothetical protein
MAAVSTIAYVEIGNAESRLSAERWAALIGMISVLLAQGGDAGVILCETPLFSAPTAINPRALWAIALPTTHVLRAQGFLARAAAAYPEVSITWAETNPRRIYPAPPDPVDSDQPITEPAPGPVTA